MKKKKFNPDEILEGVYEFFAQKGQVVTLPPNTIAYVSDYPGGFYDSPCRVIATYEKAVIADFGTKRWLISFGYTDDNNAAELMAIKFSDGDDLVKLIGQNYERSHSLVYEEPTDGEIDSGVKEIKRFLEDELKSHTAKPYTCTTKKDADGGEVFVLDCIKYDNKLSRALFGFLWDYLKNKKP